MLSIAVTFVRGENGEYGGKEFPPGPSRLLQAMIAGVQDDTWVRPAIEAFETLPPPEIYAVPIQQVNQYDYQAYVPNNDDTVPHTNSEKKQENRVRLFRASGPHVVYVWKEFPAELVDIVRHAVSQICSLGRSMDLVIASLCEEVPGATFDHYVPADLHMSGDTVQLWNPVSGFFKSVESKFCNGGRCSRVKVKYVSYCRNPKPLPSFAVFDLMQLDRVRKMAVPVWRAVHVAEWVRHAAMAASPEGTKLISGHIKGNNRVSILPLPSVGMHVDDKVRRVMITEPPGSDGRVVADLKQCLNGKTLTMRTGRAFAICRFPTNPILSYLGIPGTAKRCGRPSPRVSCPDMMTVTLGNATGLSAECSSKRTIHNQ